MSSDGIKTYRVYFFNAHNRITDTAVLDCSDDEVCIERARAMLRDQRDYRAVEIWQEHRKVGLYDRQTVTSDAPVKDGGASTD